MFQDGLIFFSESKKCIMSGDSPSLLPTVIDGAMTRLAIIEGSISAWEGSVPRLRVRLNFYCSIQIVQLSKGYLGLVTTLHQILLHR